MEHSVQPEHRCRPWSSARIGVVAEILSGAFLNGSLAVFAARLATYVTTGFALRHRSSCVSKSADRQLDVRSYTIIDDISDAVESLSPLGQELVGPAATRIRDEIIALAQVRGWSIVTHRSFVDWANRRPPFKGEWILLDPLVLPGSVFGVARHLTVERCVDVDSPDPQFVVRNRSLRTIRRGTAVMLLDDAVHSGSTVRVVSRAMADRGVRLLGLVVGVGRAGALLDLHQGGLPVACYRQVESTCEIMHLRDSLCWLPRSGRRVEARFVCLDGRPRLSVRISPLLFRADKWRAPLADDRLRNAILHSIRSVVVDFTRYLGTTALVAHLPMLGAHVSAPVTQAEESIGAGVPLEYLGERLVNAIENPR